MEQWLTWNIKDFTKICNQCLPPNHRVNRHYIQRYIGLKTTFDLNDFRRVCGSNQADEFIAARLRAKWEFDEAKAEAREAQKQWRAGYLNEWFTARPDYLPGWEKAHPESRRKRNRRYYLKMKLNAGTLSQKK